MDRIVANAAELRTAISAVQASVGQAKAMFDSATKKLEDGIAAARSPAERERLAKELETFTQKANAAMAQIKGNAARTSSAFARRLGLVSGKRG